MIADLLKALASARKRFDDALSNLRRRLLYKAWLWTLFFVVILAICLLLAEELANALEPVVESAKDGMDGKSVLMGFGLIAGLSHLLLARSRSDHKPHYHEDQDILQECQGYR